MYSFCLRLADKALHFSRIVHIPRWSIGPSTFLRPSVLRLRHGTQSSLVDYYGLLHNPVAILTTASRRTTGPPEPTPTAMHTPSRHPGAHPPRAQERPLHPSCLRSRLPIPSSNLQKVSLPIRLAGLLRKPLRVRAAAKTSTVARQQPASLWLCEDAEG